MESSSAEIERAIVRCASILGYTELRPKQAVVVRAFVSGRDVFVSLPTGSGKSLCYSLLPKVFDDLRHRKCESIAVIISPLVALMKDQVRSMTERHVSSVYVGDADAETEAAVCSGHFQLVFISPEALLTDARWRDMLLNPVYQENLVALVVDEAHCVKKWWVSLPPSPTPSLPPFLSPSLPIACSVCEACLYSMQG